MAVNEKKIFNWQWIFKKLRLLKDDAEKSVKNVANFRQVLRRRRSSLVIFVGRRVASVM
jgi:hypothetical protein